MKKLIFAVLFFLALAPLLLFQETEDVLKNNQKFLQGGPGGAVFSKSAHLVACTLRWVWVII